MKINKSFWRVQGTFFQKGSLAAGGKIAVIILIFLVSLAVRLYKLDDKSAWTDESKQAGLAAIPPYNFNMAERASMQQQPPLDYFFEAVFIQNFGLKETGIRLHAALFGGLRARQRIYGLHQDTKNLRATGRVIVYLSFKYSRNFSNKITFSNCFFLKPL